MAPMTAKAVNGVKETASLLIKREGWLGWMLLVGGLVLVVVMLGGAYFAQRWEQATERLLEFAQQEAAEERDVRQELLELQRESLLSKRANVQALEALVISSKAQQSFLGQLLLLLSKGSTERQEALDELAQISELIREHRLSTQ